MYVCLCQGITDAQIRSAVQRGCCSYREVRQCLGVATQCGKCACTAKQVVRETLCEVKKQAAITFTEDFIAA
jgi:bacterioferritin-associated ferredoxin